MKKTKKLNLGKLTIGTLTPTDLSNANGAVGGTRITNDATCSNSCSSCMANTCHATCAPCMQ